MSRFIAAVACANCGCHITGTATSGSVVFVRQDLPKRTKRNRVSVTIVTFVCGLGPQQYNIISA